jgi:hypothetical protein
MICLASSDTGSDAIIGTLIGLLDVEWDGVPDRANITIPHEFDMNQMSSYMAILVPWFGHGNRLMRGKFCEY